MNEAEATNQHDATSVGTPLNYSESVYRFYLELADCSRATRRLIEEFLPQHQTARIADLDYGFELEMPIQCAPDLARVLLGGPRKMQRSLAEGASLISTLSRSIQNSPPDIWARLMSTDRMLSAGTMLGGVLSGTS